MEPLNAYDRYVIHQALKEDQDVETHSVEVDGSDKKVILIRPKRR
jgi:predicted RNA-binding protein Jag